MNEPQSTETGYKNYTNEAINNPSTGRGIENYAIKLGFKNSEKFLESLPINAKILDIGSGENKLKMELLSERPDATVFSINPSLTIKENRKNGHRLDLTISAINPFIPYADESFDVVLDNMASVFYSQRKDKRKYIDPNIREIARVLKKGGSAFVGPLFVFNKNQESLDIINKTVKSIENLSMSEKPFKIPPKERSMKSIHIKKNMY